MTRGLDAALLDSEEECEEFFLTPDYLHSSEIEFMGGPQNKVAHSIPYEITGTLTVSF